VPVKRATSLPNLLTYARIVAVPLVAVFLFWPQETWARWWAFGLYAAAGITDYFDGYVARAWGMQSTLGQMLDPIADKLLIAVCLLMLVAVGTITHLSLIPAIVILSREILVSGLREHLAALKVSVPVSQIAKWKTAFQIVAVGFLVAGPAGEKVLPSTIEIGLVLLWVAAILTLYTGAEYVKNGIKPLMDADNIH
jgi:cardiolipin synthase (CMP-forming)